MRISAASFLLAALAATQREPANAFSFAPSRSSTQRQTGSKLFSTAAPPSPTKSQTKTAIRTEEQEVYGTVVGDTKGAALRLENVAISRGASPLLQNIEWSVQPNERWGIVGVNGAGYVHKNSV